MTDSPESREPGRPCFLPEDETGVRRSDAEITDESVDLARAAVRALLANAGITVTHWPEDKLPPPTIQE